MNNWTELHIGIVYFSGLIIAVISCILIILYLRPVKTTLKKISSSPGIWNSSFKTTVILGGLLGAMSVSFTDCEGRYEYLLASEFETFMKGCEQVSASFGWLAFVLGLWSVIFVILRLVSQQKKGPEEVNR
jgi:hypothetical protein